MIRKISVGDAPELEWFKNTYSDSSDGNDCVEVATTATTAAIHVRDSKNPHGPRLTVRSTAWVGFVAHTAQR